MFSTFSKFSANNIDRINRVKPSDQGSDSEFDKKIKDALENIKKFEDLQERRKGYDKEDKEKKSANDSKHLGGDTNQMIFGAMVFAFLVIATMGVAAMGAGPLGVAAMGVFAAGVGGALVAKVGKKLRDKVLKPQHNFSKTNSGIIDNLAKELEKKVKKEFASNKQESPSSPSSGNKMEVKDLKEQVAGLTKQLMESQENQGIKALEDKIMKHAEKALGSHFKDSKDIKLFENDSGEKENFGTFITKLKNALSKHDDNAVDDTTTKLLKELVDKCDSASDNTKGIKPNEKKLVYGALKDIFKDCKDDDRKKDALKDAIKKDPNTSIDQLKSDEVKQLVKEKTQTVKKGMDKAEADDKIVNDRINQPKVAGQQI